MANLLIVDDDVDLAESLAGFLRRSGHAVTLAHDRQSAAEAYRAVRPDLVLLDLQLPDGSGFDVYSAIRDDDPVVVMITGHGDVPMAVQAMREGVENFLTKPVEMVHLAAAIDRGLEKARLRRLGRYLRERRSLATAATFGASPVMRDIGGQVELLAASDRTTVLILGETGSGKGQVAESIHRLGARRDRAFVEVPCAAYRAEALEAELFGRERDSTGEARSGLLEVANGGTLFLDEIGELDPHLQLRLLHVLDAGAFRRRGGTQEVAVDVRVIASTTRDLVTDVNEGRFREDLYYRLSVMPVYLPPLRVRSRDDVLELVARLLAELQPSLPLAPGALADEVVERLLRYPWPGNIRELRNVLERALIVARGSARVEIAHLPAEVREADGAAVEHHVPRTLEEVERAHVERTLRVHEGNRTHAARELGISRATLIKKIRQYGLDGRPREGLAPAGRGA
jgi:two-component system response regulator AtoC